MRNSVTCCSATLAAAITTALFCTTLTHTATVSGPADIVLYAADVPAANIHGLWKQLADDTAAAGVKLTIPDAGIPALASPLSTPTHYFDVPFEAPSGTVYRVWLRIHAIADSKFNDSVFVQYSDAIDSTGAAIYRAGTTAGLLVNLWTCGTCQSFGWGWQRSAYWLANTGDVTFQNSGPHTIRVQIREDGAEIDQIVLSASTYATNPPGLTSSDTTIVPKPFGVPERPAMPNPTDRASGVSRSPILTWVAPGATNYDVEFGTTNPPPLVSPNQTAPSYNPMCECNTGAPTELAYNTMYFWQVIARNSVGTTAGPLWSFTTIPAPPPSVPVVLWPANGATGVDTTSFIQWASGSPSGRNTPRTFSDVSFGTTNPPPLVAVNLPIQLYRPAMLPNTTYFWQVTTHNTSGTAIGPVWSFRAAATATPRPEIVIDAVDMSTSALHGSWSTAEDLKSLGGIKLATTDIGFATTAAPLAQPTDFIDVTFPADANTPYTLWLRLKALNDSKFNDSVFVQFSDAFAGGAEVFPINSTSGLLVNLATSFAATSLKNWGWQNTAYWLVQPTTFTFPTTAMHTMRIQVREDGVQLDQIVLSGAKYLTTPPGRVTDDGTFVR